MKYSIFLTLSYIAIVSALPTGQQVYRYDPAAKWISTPQRMMFMRYMQPHFARSSQAAALVDEEGVAASGSVLQDTEGVLISDVPVNPVGSIDEQVLGSDVDLTNVANPEVLAAPEEEVQVPELVTTSERDSRVFLDLEPTAENEIPRGEQETNVAIPAQPALNDDEETEEPKIPARLPVEHRPTKADSVPTKPLTSGTFFPVDFGGVQGGAIAIAHSLSTDNGGAASSNAIAYGTPSALGSSARLSARRH